MSCSARTLRALGLVAAVFVLLLLAAACGDQSGGVAESPSLGELVSHRFDSREHRFSLIVPDAFSTIVTQDTQLPKGAAAQWRFVDTEGAIAEGTALDFFALTIYKAKPAIESGNLAKHKDALAELIATQIVGGNMPGMPELKVTLQPTLTKLNGDEALETRYEYGVGPKHVTAIGYLVPRGTELFWLAAQTSPGSAPNTKMDLLFESIRFE